MKLRIRYNAPVVLTLTFAAVAVMIASQVTDGKIVQTLFTAQPSFSPPQPINHIGLVAHILGHASWQDLAGNFFLILLIGPLLEEKYGSGILMLMIFITALIAGAVNALFFKVGLVGASGVAFMMILLASLSNFRRGEIPLTFILVAAIYLGREGIEAFKSHHISQFAHIIGGFGGAGFGFLMNRAGSEDEECEEEEDGDYEEDEFENESDSRGADDLENGD